jgi:hypothetical protein
MKRSLNIIVLAVLMCAVPIIAQAAALKIEMVCSTHPTKPLKANAHITVTRAASGAPVENLGPGGYSAELPIGWWIGLQWESAQLEVTEFNNFGYGHYHIEFAIPESGRRYPIVVQVTKGNLKGSALSNLEEVYFQ